MTEVTIRVFTPAEFYDQIDKMEEAMPDYAISLGRLQGRNVGTRLDTDANVKRLGDFIYPAELFAEESRTDDLESANSTLVATGIFPSEYLDTSNDDVIGYDEYSRQAREIASEFDDPVFFVGAWSPSGSYNITGNPDNNKPRKIGSMAFSESIFSTAQGCEPLNKLHLGFPGTVVIEADQLTDETVAYARGERDQLPIEEREDDRMDAEELNNILRSLSDGDRIQVNDRNRPLTVVPRSHTRRIGIADHKCVFLTGNGTEYRIKIPNTDSRYPELDWASDSEYIGELEVVERGDETEQEVIA